MVRAHNTATASLNKIHDDAVAREFGFHGGLVPGVDVYAYMTHPPAEAWGREWLASGRMSARFVRPVYDEDEITVSVNEAGGTVTIEVIDSAGVVCATGQASPGRDTPVPNTTDWPATPLPESPPLASPEAFAAMPVLGSIESRFEAGAAPDYLGAIRENLAVYDEVAHPGWLLRHANTILGSNVRLGPWIHVSSDVTHHSLVTDGDRLSTRAHVVSTDDRRGHRFVTIDVALFANDSRAVSMVRHTAIYEPRRRSGEAG